MGQAPAPDPSPGSQGCCGPTPVSGNMHGSPFNQVWGSVGASEAFLPIGQWVGSPEVSQVGPEARTPCLGLSWECGQGPGRACRQVTSRASPAASGRLLHSLSVPGLWGGPCCEGVLQGYLPSPRCLPISQLVGTPPGHDDSQRKTGEQLQRGPLIRAWGLEAPWKAPPALPSSLWAGGPPRSAMVSLPPSPWAAGPSGPCRGLLLGLQVRPEGLGLPQMLPALGLPGSHPHCD